MGFHMHPPQGILSALPAQEALLLRPSAALSGLLLVVDSRDPRSRQRHAQGAPPYLPPTLKYRSPVSSASEHPVLADAERLCAPSLGAAGCGRCGCWLHGECHPHPASESMSKKWEENCRLQ